MNDSDADATWLYLLGSDKVNSDARGDADVHDVPERSNDTLLEAYLGLNNETSNADCFSDMRYLSYRNQTGNSSDSFVTSESQEKVSHNPHVVSQASGGMDSGPDSSENLIDMNLAHLSDVEVFDVSAEIAEESNSAPDGSDDVSSTDKIVKVFNQVMTEVRGCTNESLLFAADRASTASNLYIRLLAKDDPENQHLDKINQTPIVNSEHGVNWEWDVLKVRCRLASLSWYQRQLVQDTREVDFSQTDSCPTHDFNPHSSVELPGSSLSDYNAVDNMENMPYMYTDDDTHASDVISECTHPPLVLNNTPQKSEIFHSNDQTSKQDKAQKLHRGLVSAAALGDIDARRKLTSWFVPPAFVESPVCFQCSDVFSVSKFRHHCRHCGLSFCSHHAKDYRVIYKFGFVSPVRICEHCVQVVDEEHHNDRLIWKLLRIQAYFNKSQISYFERRVDLTVDKAMRVATGTLAFVRNAISLNYPAKIAIDTIDILRRYGLSGLAGVLMRHEFVEAVETLKKISGIDKMFSMSLSELTACIYYKMAIDRGLRGCHPENELHIHSEETSDVLPPAAVSDSVPEPDKSDPKKAAKPSNDITDAELEDVIRFAPLALKFAYLLSPVDCERLAGTLGWSTVYIQNDSRPEQPAFVLFAAPHDSNLSENGGISTSSSSNNNVPADFAPERKVAVLTVRGTQTISDVVTDIRATPQEFPPEVDEIIDRIVGQRNSCRPMNEWNEGLTEVGAVTACPSLQSQGWEWLQMSENSSFACGGMARAALWLVSEVGPSLLALKQRGYEIVLVGHSLGGSVAALTTFLLHTVMPDVRCVTYGCPSCVSDSLADEMRSYVTSVVLHDDIICRITPNSIRTLMQELMIFRSQIFRYLHQDWTSVIDRAATLWAPQWREEVKHAKTPPPTVSGVSGAALSSLDLLGGGGIRNLVTEEESTSPELVVVEDDVIADLWIPGKIFHIFSHRGQYRISKVSKEFPPLRRIIIQGNLFRDHDCQFVYDALLEVRCVRAASSSPPVWVKYDQSPCCQICQSSFTWHSTFRGEAQEYKERYNCRCCGALVCDPCSSHRHSIVRLGLIFPCRVCDNCFYSGAFAEL